MNQTISENSLYYASFFDEEGVQFAFKSLGFKTHHPIEVSQKPAVISSLTCKDLVTGETIHGMFALHSTLLTFYGVHHSIICVFYRIRLIFQNLQNVL